MEVKDSNGTVLADGDTVTLIKDLKLKGSSSVLKRGTVVKKIKLTERIEHKPNFISQGNFRKFFEDWLIRQFKFIESLKNNKLLKM